MTADGSGEQHDAYSDHDPREPDEFQPRSVRRYLLPTERLVFAVRRHPMMMFWPLVVTYLAVLLTAFVWLATPPGSPLPTLVLIGALVAAGWLLFRAVDWGVERLVLTDQRILLLSGVLTRKVGMMPLPKVTDMTYERSLLGRLTGYGTFVMESAGQDQALHRVAYIPAPDVLYLEVADLLFGPQDS